MATSLDDYNSRKEKSLKIKGNSVLINTLDVYKQAIQLELTGDPELDWRNMRSLLANGVCKRLKEIADEVRNVRILDRGCLLYTS